MTTDLKGELAESIAKLRLMKSGYLISLPINKCRYDLLADDGLVIWKIQVKKAIVSKDYLKFNTCSVSRNGTSKQYKPGEVDKFLVVDIDSEEAYLIDLDDCCIGSQRLRLSDTKNNQSKGILFAKNYKI